MEIPGDVLDAFDLQGEALLLPGGEGRTFRVGGAVLRREHPADVPDAELAADLFVRLDPTPLFRVPTPIPTRAGGWVTEDGWTAWTYVDGHPAGAADAPALVAALDAFHRAIAPTPCPAYLQRGARAYDRADRGAFGDPPDDVDPGVRPTLEALYAFRRPLRGLTDQLIHGDANGANVLIAPGLPPAIIDFAPYWRPPEFAIAVAALWLCAYQGHTEVFASFERVREFDQLLLRALLRTLLTMDGLRGAGDLGDYVPSIEIVSKRLTRSWPE